MKGPRLPDALPRSPSVGMSGWRLDFTRDEEYAEHANSRDGDQGLVAAKKQPMVGDMGDAIESRDPSADKIRLGTVSATRLCQCGRHADARHGENWSGRRWSKSQAAGNRPVISSW